MVLATEIMLPPTVRRNSYGGSDSTTSKSPPPNKSHWWFFTSKLKSSDEYGGSQKHVATQKLRSSKWFHQDEERLVCAVIETGFIVELMQSEQQHQQQQQQPETDTDVAKSHYGVVIVEVKKKDKKPTANDIHVYTVSKCESRLKVVKFSVAELWSQGYKIRINNMNDKTKHINSEKEIKSQITYAVKHKQIFHNSLHFVDHCRYGAHLEERKRQVSESVKWGGIGMNASIFLMQREKSHSFSK